MTIHVNAQVVPFGHIVVNIGPNMEQAELSLPHEEVHYQEPSDTASFVYEIRYEQQQCTYVAPSSFPLLS